MAGKRVSFPNPRNYPSPSSPWAKPSTLIFGLTVAILILTSFLFYSYTRQQNPRFAITNSYARYTVPQYSFVASLEEFLNTRAPLLGSERESDGSAAAGSSTFGADPVFDERALDPSVLKVYVYDMPSKFTYDLLWLFRNTYKETENLTSNGSPVHRLIEQHSIDYWLWADLIAPEPSRLLKNVIRVQSQEEADLFYIPFFTTISFFLMEKQQCKRLYREALKWVTDQPSWKRSEGRDHILPVHHPWSFKSVRRFMKKAIWLLPDMDSTGNWYKPGQVYLEKDVILPYAANVDVCDAKCLSVIESQRKTLIFFRGRLKRNAGGKIRAKLVDELRNKEGVIIEEGTIGQAGKKASQDGMRSSIFCLSPAGDTPSSARLFDAIVSGCIPVIVSDELELPFEGLLNYNKMAVFVSSRDALQPGWLLAHLKAIDPSTLRDMRVNLAQSVRHFLYSSPAQPLGPEDLTWRMIAGKLLNIKLHIRRSQRMVEGSRNVCTCDCRVGNRTTTNPQDP
ncbi:putative arabinosyltransferase [Nymphaea thermarum]|nr:putative arabinosyltransferase [Nymphaea thermarum]